MDEYVQKKNIAKCFKAIKFIYAELDETEDIYKKDEKYNNTNWTNGPNYMFFRLFKKKLLPNYIEYFMYMEPDTIPIRSFWIDKIIRECRDEDTFWIKGSIYRGNEWDKYIDKIDFRYHINGNALYTYNNNNFKKFLDLVEKEYPKEISYDVAISNFIFNSKNWKITSKIFHKYRYSNFIENIGTIKCQKQLDISQCIHNKDDVFFLHIKKQENRKNIFENKVYTYFDIYNNIEKKRIYV